MMEKKLKLSVYLASVILYLPCVIYGMVCWIGSFAPVQAQAPSKIVAETLQGIALAFVPLLLEKIFRIEISFTANLMLFIFSFSAIFLGQFVGLYYCTSWWDKITHVMSAAMLFLFGTALAGVFFKDNPTKTGVIVFGFLFALAAGFLWELAEFTIDSVFGSNMQCFIPENDLWNGGSSFDNLNGTLEEIGSFFLTPEGYRYALMDTMFDVVADTCGAGAGAAVLACLSKEKCFSLFHMVHKKPRKEKAA